MTNQRRARLLGISSVAAYTLSNLSGWLLPVVVSDAMTALNLSATQGGLVVAGETLAIALSTLLLTRHSFGLRYLTIAMVGAVVALICTIASAFAHDFSSLLALRLLTGLGEGAVMMVANSLAASDENPDRAFAHMNVINILYGSSLFLLMPMLWPNRSGLTVFSIAAWGMVVLLPLMFWLSRRTAEDHKEVLIQSGQFRPISTSALLLLSAAMLFIGSAAGATWTFMAEFGKQTGMTPDAIDSAIGVATLSAIVGSGMAGFLFRHFGRFWPLAVGTLVVTGACYSIANAHDGLHFRIEAVVVLISMYFLLPGLLSAGADIDRSGRVSAVVGAVFMLTLAIGPAVAGWVADHFGLPQVGLTALGMGVAALVSLLLFHRKAQTL